MFAFDIEADGSTGTLPVPGLLIAVIVGGFLWLLTNLPNSVHLIGCGLNVVNTNSIYLIWLLFNSILTNGYKEGIG